MTQTSGPKHAKKYDALVEGLERGAEERRKLIPFSSEEYERRLTRVRALMRDAEIDLLLVTLPESMCYLHGYEARWYRSHSTRAWPPFAATAVHVDSDEMVHFDFLDEVTLLRATSIVEDIRFFPDESEASCLRFLGNELEAKGWLGSRAALEFYSYVPHRVIGEKIQAVLESAGSSVRDGSGVLLEARRLKSPVEIESVKRAAEIQDIGLRRLQEVLRPGISELEAWAEMMLAMTRAGGEPAGLHEVISTYAGHAISSRKEIRENEPILVDPCGVYNRYHSNSARVFWIGTPPDEFVELNRKAGNAFALLEQCVKPGASIAGVNAQLREYYQEAGIWDLRDWVGGYELGISFPPDWVGDWYFTVDEVSPEGSFEEGLVSNFESVVGTCIIDTFVVERGGASLLGKLPYELIVV